MTTERRGKRRKRKPLRLYVWREVLTDHTSGMMFAIASSVDDARRQLREKASYLPDEDVGKEPSYIVPVTKCCADFVYGGG